MNSLVVPLTQEDSRIVDLYQMNRRLSAEANSKPNELLNTRALVLTSQKYRAITWRPWWRPPDNRELNVEQVTVSSNWP